MTDDFGFAEARRQGMALGPVGQSLVLDDDLTRVWGIVLAPGAALGPHIHRHPYLLLPLGGGTVRRSSLDGSGEDLTLVAGEARRVDAKHGIESLANAGDAPIELRLVEFKSVRWVFPDEPVETPAPSGNAVPEGFAAAFREILIQAADLDWSPKSLPGLSQKMLWRNDETGASIALIRFEKGVGIPNAHAHASNQFMFCLSGQYRYIPTGTTLVAGSFYCNPTGSVHGPTIADETTVFLEIYDGPHYPVQPPWYSDAEDAR